MPEGHTETEVLIVGAGFSGLGASRMLQEEGLSDHVIVERADTLGGTWRDNGYPGCACDIPSVLYCYESEQNPDWTRAFAPRDEILEYLRAFARRHDLERRIRYRHELLSADYDERRQRWEVQTTGGSFTTRVLISAVGGLSDPSIPALPGLETFAGTAFHSARWNHDHDLAGRRAAVIGTGASAIQLVPEIVEGVERLTLLQRTPPWVMPRGNPPIPPGLRRAFRRRPRLQRLARAALFELFESFHLIFQHPALSRLARRRALANLERQVADPALRAKLTPDYELGCKRVLGSTTWYPALCRPNVDVVTDGIARVTETGIVDAAGVHHEVDTIIFATGFHATDPPIAGRVRGRAGVSLADRCRGSMKAHLGIGVHGLPNFAMLLGPNTALGHNSVLLMIEAQLGYLRRLLVHRGEHGLATFEPTASAQRRFVDEVDRGTRGSVWTAGGCVSWYLDATGRNSALWPGSVRAYRRRLATFDVNDWTFEPLRPAPEPAIEPAVVA
ncbi:MAG TPA: NAD(P)/FAD-dependent oxidoreductase [Solirubrobacteraceae bacterium]|nr:NAD(P)/FAD-dependent oxidoreductase [Solirubrobacteraceae bacterium]